ncbi:hypothetical protein PENTCL1PPCAC_15980, partial [Pristionchus entomophagus]
FMITVGDPFAAIGRNNQTYWLMLLVRSEVIIQWKQIYYTAAAIEVSLTIAGVYLHFRLAILLLKHKILHLNFMIIGMNVYGVMLIGSLAHLVTILYETRIIELPSLGYEPVPTLAIVRQISYGFVNGILMASCALVPNINCAIMFRLMLNHNKRRHARLTNKIKRHPDDEYSLSLRVQLKENIWSMQKIEFGVYALTAALAFNLLFVFLPVFFLTTPDQYELLQCFTCAGNLSFALTITTTAPILEMTVAIHKGNVPRILVRLIGRE